MKPSTLEQQPAEIQSDAARRGSVNVGLQIGGANFFNRYVLISATNQGVYLGTHEIDPAEVVNYVFELKPGCTNSVASRFPKVSEFIRSGYRRNLCIWPSWPRTRLACFLGSFLHRTKVPQGTWHAGVDIYKEWRSTWFLRPVAPGWTQKVHSWQQVQIRSFEEIVGAKHTPFGVC